MLRGATAARCSRRRSWNKDRMEVPPGRDRANAAHSAVLRREAVELPVPAERPKLLFHELNLKINIFDFFFNFISEMGIAL